MSARDSDLLVAWDVDDVLNDLTLRWADWAGFSISMLAPPTGDPSSWISSQGINHNEYLASLDHFRDSEYPGLEPNEAVLDVLRGWPRWRTTHIALSATPLFAQAIVASWTMRHFGHWLRAIWFCPSPRTTDPRGTTQHSKGDVLNGFRNSTLLVDDSVSNLESAQATSRVVLYPRPWNTFQPTTTSSEYLTSLLQLDESESGGTFDANSG